MATITSLGFTIFGKYLGTPTFAAFMRDMKTAENTAAATGKRMMAAGTLMTGAFTVPIVAAGAASVKLAKDFDSSMLKIQTQAYGTSKDVKVLSDGILNMKNVQDSPLKLADAMYHLKSVGMDNASAMKGLRAAEDLAAVGGSDLEQTTNAIAGAWKSGIVGANDFGSAAAALNSIVGAGNLRMQDLVDAMGSGFLPVAHTFGLSIQSVGAALATMTAQGIPADVAATRLRTTFNYLGAPTQKARDAFESIGLKATDLAEAMRSPGGLVAAIGMLKQHMDAAGLSATQQAALMSQAFGGARASSTIMTLVNSYDMLRQKQDAINKNMGGFQAAVEAQRATLSAKVKMMTSELQNLGVRVGNWLIPPLTSFVGFLAGTVVPALITVSKWFGMIPAPLKIFIGILLGILVIAGPILFFFGALATALTAIATALGITVGALIIAIGWIALIVVAVVALVAAIIWVATQTTWFQTAWTYTWNAVKLAALTVWTWMQIAFRATWQAMLVAWHAFEAAFVTVWQNVWPALKLAADVVWNALRIAWANVWGAMKVAWEAFIGPLRTAWNTIWPEMKTAGEVIWRNMSSAWSMVWGIMTGAFNIFKTVILGGWNLLWTSMQIAFNIFRTILTTIWNQLWQGGLGLAFHVFVVAIEGAWNLLWTTVRVAWSIFAAYIVPVFQGVWNTLLVVAQGLWNTLRAVWSALWTAIQAIAVGIWNFLKAAWQAVVSFFTAIFLTLMAIFTGHWTTAWNAIKAAAEAVWNAMKAAFQLFLTTLQQIWNVAWTAIKTVGQTIWNALQTLAQGIWNGMKGAFNAFIEGIKQIWNAGWTWVKNTAAAIWGAIQTGWDKFTGGFKTAVQKCVDGIKTIWNTLQDIFKVPIKFVIGTVINGGLIKGVNWVIEKLSGKKDAIPGIPMPFAAGGYVSGPGGPRSDSIPARLSNGEFVMSAEATRRIGVRTLYNMNGGGMNHDVGAGHRTGFADGGLVLTGLDGLFAGILSAGSYAGATIAKAAASVLSFLHLPGGGVMTNLANALMNFSKAQFGKAYDDIVGLIANQLISKMPSFGSGPLAAIGSGASKTFSNEALAHVKQMVIDFLYGKAQEIKAAMAAQTGTGSYAAALNWARTQVGLPYQWGGDGNPSWDCSGFMSAIESVIRGEKPHRRWSTHSFNGATAAPGWTQNASSPFVIGVTNAGVGHTAGTLNGVNVECRGGDGCLVGSSARGYNDPMFMWHYGFTAVKAATAAGSGGWAALAQQALNWAGINDQLSQFLALMQAESAGNPNAINNYDYNAQHGYPSKGLMQVIDPTFQAYRNPALPNNIYDPLANMSASANYIKHVYGGIVPGSPYANGTFGAIAGWHIVGERGPELWHARGGETVLANKNLARVGGGGPIEVKVHAPITIQGDATLEAVDRLSNKVVPDITRAVQQGVGKLR